MRAIKNLEKSFQPGSGFNKVQEGGRNDTLFKALKEDRSWANEKEILDRALQLNWQMLDPPLGDAEVTRIAQSIWNYHANDQLLRKGGEAKIMVPCDLILQFESAPDAYWLLCRLRAAHWGRKEFNLVPATAKSWTPRRFRKARDLLEELGYIICAKRGQKGKRDKPIYQLNKEMLHF